MSTVVYLQNALCPQRRRIEQFSGRSIRDLAPAWQTPYVAFVDGEPVLRVDWELVIEDDRALYFIDVNALPQGGGGGGSNPLAMVLMLAVMIFAPYMGAFMGPGFLFGEGVLGLSAAAWTNVTMMAGMALINAILPAPKPTTPQQAAALASPSPTYALQAQGNTARLEAAIPEHFGRLMCFPDLAAQPYQEFSGNEQYLFQMLCIGRGEYSFSAGDIRIEDTPIDSFDDIAYEVIAPGASPTLFPSNVISSTEVSGQDLTCIAGTYAQSGTTVTITAVGHGLATGNSVYLDYTSGSAVDGSFTVASAPTADTFTVAAAASLSASGNVTVSKWIGGFIASASGTAANFIGLDFVLARGLYFVDGTGVLQNVSVSVTADYRTVDVTGAVFGTWGNLSSITYSASTTTPQRYSTRDSVTPGRYQVRVRRVDVKQTDNTYGHDIAWAGMRAYLPDARTYGDVTLLALRMRASNNLSAMASRKINVICTRKLPIWNGSTWSANTDTRSIAWALVYACKQIGLTDAQLDLAGLATLDATWTVRGDTFDGRFDNFLSFWEAASKIAQAGRAKPFMQGGIVRLRRDQAQSIPVCLFSMRNIVRGSFSINYLMPTTDTADAVDVRYFDAGSWSSAKVRAALPGSSLLKPSKVDLFGVTSRDQAFREGMYQAAANRYRRKIVKFQTEMEGFIPSYGDLIAIQHDMPAWGQGGEVVGVDSSSNLAVNSEDFSVDAWQCLTNTANCAVAPNGRMTADLLTITSIGDAFSIHLAYPLGVHVQSVFVKKSVGSNAANAGFRPIIWATSLVDYDMAFDFDTKTFSGANYLHTARGYVDCGNGWYRLWVEFPAQPGQTQIDVRVFPDRTVLGGELLVWGVQVTAGSGLKAYVPTTSASIASATVLTLSEPLTWSAGTHYIALRKRDGSVDGPYATRPAA